MMYKWWIYTAALFFKRIILSSLFPCSIIYITITDEFLYVHSIYVLQCSSIFFILGCMLVLFTAASYRLKESMLDIPAELLSDSDIESDEESIKVYAPQTSRYNCFKLLSHFIAFCKSHAIYGIISVLGISFLVGAINFTILANLFKEDSLLSEDFSYSAVYLIISGTMLTVTVISLANVNGAYKEDTRHLKYTIFDEHIHVPTKIIAGKAFSFFLTGEYKYIIQLLVSLTCCVYGVYGVLSISVMTRENIHIWQDILRVNNIQSLLYVIIGVVILVGISLLGRLNMHFYRKARQNLLITMEGNWQKNICACEILLPDANVNSLETLKCRLRGKSRNQWTTEEKLAFDYIAMPLWKHKRTFVEKSK